MKFTRGKASSGYLTRSNNRPLLSNLRVNTGDTAYEIGKYKLTTEPPGGSTTKDEGKYLVVWKQQGGSWKLHADIWNTNLLAAQ